MTNFANEYKTLFINPLANAEKKTGLNIAKNLPVLQAAMDAVKKADISALRQNGTTDTKAFKAALAEWAFLTDFENRTHLYANRQLIKANISIDQIAEKLAAKPVKSIAGVWGLFKPAKPAVRQSAANGGNAGGNSAAVNPAGVNIAKCHLIEAIQKITVDNYGAFNSADIQAALRDIGIAMLKDNGISENSYKEFQKLNKKAA